MGVADLLAKKKKALAEKNLKEGQEFQEEFGKLEGVTTLDSGLQYQILEDAKGKFPKPKDFVICHYHGTTIHGEVFDSSVERGEPITFPLNQVISGWTEGVQLMPVGSKWKIYLPSNIAYGERGAGGDIGPNSVLIFEVELLEIVKPGAEK